MRISLLFSAIDELLDFKSVVKTYVYSYNLKVLTIDGRFSDAEIELASRGYNAKVICLKQT